MKEWPRGSWGKPEGHHRRTGLLYANHGPRTVGQQMLSHQAGQSMWGEGLGQGM